MKQWLVHEQNSVLNTSSNRCMQERWGAVYQNIRTERLSSMKKQAYYYQYLGTTISIVCTFNLEENGEIEVQVNINIQIDNLTAQ